MRDVDAQVRIAHLFFRRSSVCQIAEQDLKWHFSLLFRFLTDRCGDDPLIDHRDLPGDKVVGDDPDLMILIGAADRFTDSIIRRIYNIDTTLRL